MSYTLKPLNDRLTASYKVSSEDLLAALPITPAGTVNFTDMEALTYPQAAPDWTYDEWKESGMLEEATVSRIKQVEKRLAYNTIATIEKAGPKADKSLEGKEVLVGIDNLRPYTARGHYKLDLDSGELKVILTNETIMAFKTKEGTFQPLRDNVEIGVEFTPQEFEEAILEAEREEGRDLDDEEKGWAILRTIWKNKNNIAQGRPMKVSGIITAVGPDVEDVKRGELVHLTDNYPFNYQYANRVDFANKQIFYIKPQTILNAAIIPDDSEAAQEE